MKKSHLKGALCAAVCSFITLPSHAALVDNGGGLIYDTLRDITWSQPDIKRTWNDANAWATGLMLGGVSGWRLPYIDVNAGAGPFGSPVDCTATPGACHNNELGYMFYQNLSGTLGMSILTSGDPDLALFPTLQPSYYWSGTGFNSSIAWNFNFGSFDVNDPNQPQMDGGLKNAALHYTWFVHDGNVSPVPVPAAVWLFGSGLLGLIGIARRKKTA